MISRSITKLSKPPADSHEQQVPSVGRESVLGEHRPNRRVESYSRSYSTEPSFGVDERSADSAATASDEQSNRQRRNDRICRLKSGKHLTIAAQPVHGDPGKSFIATQRELRLQGEEFALISF